MNKSTIALIVLVIGLILLPFIQDSRSILILMTQIFILGVFAMSYNLLLGYTGIISFGHAMFFGIGAYSIGLIMRYYEPTYLYFLFAVVTTLILTAIVSYLVGLLTLRLHSHFFAMFTFAIAGLFLVAAEKWRSLTLGNDGITFKIPDFFKDRVIFYLLSLGLLVLAYLFFRRFTQSPFGKVLQAIRENEKRVESLGYRVFHYKIIANVISGMIAGLAGIFYAVSLRFVNTSVFSTEITLDALMMTIIGGVGTLFGPILGSAIVQFAQYSLMDLAKVHWIFERWVILFGIIYIVVVMFFPSGIVGTVKTWFTRRNKQILGKKKPEGKKSMESSKADAMKNILKGEVDG
ncbi:branched-chain amino acid ABC transporter permease [Chengkuizengella axinellae]|uniref:Branched-chain amino acid ABC transporter permease n=1 Tax=Chengkuizengella axinellae TaxID=3064388 RepID=A0ABT9J1Z0_9BACL|nr:branched-chain amino acid ABC transporter permease [Chengkuizengella sp. 2205SS18-9]MDP5275629.1 branched-chain amino acid ABC transporter permease [Chengkuizengella sp. 2205SS18-9]